MEVNEEDIKLLTEMFYSVHNINISEFSQNNSPYCLIFFKKESRPLGTHTFGEISTHQILIKPEDLRNHQIEKLIENGS